MKNIFRRSAIAFLAVTVFFSGALAPCICADNTASASSELQGSLVYADGEEYDRDKIVSFENEKQGKYIAVVATGTISDGVRMREIEVYDELGNKLSRDGDIKSVKLARLDTDGILKYELIHPSPEDTDVAQKLFDGDKANHFDLVLDWNGKEWTDCATIIIELENSIKISGINVYTGTSSSYHYNAVKIYISETFEMLLSESDDFDPNYTGDKSIPLGGSLVYADGEEYTNGKTVAFSTARKGKYIAVVLTASADGYWSRMREIEIYDGEGNKLGKNSGVASITTGRFRYGVFETADAKPASMLDAMLDGNYYDNSDFFVNMNDGYLPALLVELDDVYNISKIKIYTGVRGSDQYKHAVKIYASETLDTLFSEPKVLSGNQVYSDPETGFELDKAVTFATPRIGRYIAVMVRKVPIAIPRMREIEIYDKDGNLLALSDDEQYNGIRFATAFSYHPEEYPYYVTGTVKCDATENVETAVSYLFDKNKTRHWDFANLEWANYIGFLIELDSNIAISEIKVYSGMATSEPEPIDIYVSESITDLLGKPMEYTAEASPYERLSSGELRVFSDTNLLANRSPQFINWENKENRSIGGGSADILTDGGYGAHLDIDGITDDNNHPVIVYDMMYPTEFSAVMFSGLSGGSQADYAPSYEVYIGDDYLTLISPQNLVAAKDQTLFADNAVMKMQYYAFDKKITGRYIAFRITRNARNLDAPYAAGSARVSELGAWGSYKSAETGDVNADSAVDIRDLVRLKLISGCGISDITAADLYYDEQINGSDLASLRRFLLTGLLGKKGKAVYNDTDYEITADLNTVVNEEWNGIGGNVMPMVLMTGYDSCGYNDAYWDAEVSRIIKLQPQIVRMWYQVDWLEKEKDVVNWDSNEMKAFIKYIDAFKRAGVDVQITYGWKVGSAIQDWFAFQDVPDRYVSAPADLDHYARSCYRLIKGLHDRGYTNVKYLTYANEPNIGDFETPEYIDQLDYYIEMAGKVSDYFAENNYRDKIEIWGCESASQSEWVKRCAEYPEYFDALSWHEYNADKKSIVSDINYVQDSEIKKLYLSEYSEFSFDYLASVAISGANNGLTGILNWCMNGVSDMASYPTDGHWTMNNNEADFWNSFTTLDPASKVQLGGVNRGYYIASMFNNYIAKGSKVVQSSVSNQYARSAVFVDPNTGDITVAVEFDKMSKNRNVTIDLGDINGKTFYKHAYTDALLRDQNATVPAVCDVFENVNGRITDYNVEDESSIVIYTTKAPMKQVRINNAFVELKAGKSYTFDASVVDGDGSEEIEWKILTAANHRDSNTGRTGKLTVSGSQAVYTAASDAKGAAVGQNDYQDVISVEARIKGTDIYTVALVRIIK